MNLMDLGASEMGKRWDRPQIRSLSSMVACFQLVFDTFVCGTNISYCVDKLVNRITVFMRLC